MNRRVACLFTGTSALLAVTCANPESSDNNSPLECSDTSEGVGHWKVFDPPMREVVDELDGQEVINLIPRTGRFVSDGVDLLFAEDGAHDLCVTCGWLYRLVRSTFSWTGSPRTGEHGMEPPRNLAANVEYVFMYGGKEFHPEGGMQWVTYTSRAAMLDRSTMGWSQFDPPSSFAERTSVDAQVFWTGEVFGVFGGITDDVDAPDQPDTAFTRHFDGQFFDPTTKTWREIPPLRPSETHDLDTNDPQGEVTSVWTDSGLFVWGTGKGRKAVTGLYPKGGGDWIVVDAESPPLRVFHELIAGEDFVYLIGGGIRDLWRFSLEELEWEEVEIPEFVDPKKGAWLDGKLVLLGTCASGAAYDPQSETWEKLTSDGAPPGQPGSVFVAGETLFVVDAEVQLTSHSYTSADEIWAFSFDSAAGSMGGMGGGG